MLRAKHAAPGLPEKGISILNAEVGEQAIKFLQEKRNCPEVLPFVRQAGRVAVAELAGWRSVYQVVKNAEKHLMNVKQVID